MYIFGFAFNIIFADYIHLFQVCVQIAIFNKTHKTLLVPCSAR